MSDGGTLAATREAATGRKSQPCHQSCMACGQLAFKRPDEELSMKRHAMSSRCLDHCAAGARRDNRKGVAVGRLCWAIMMAGALVMAADIQANEAPISKKVLVIGHRGASAL